MRGQGYGGTKVEGKQHYGGRHLEAAAPLFLSYSDRDIFQQLYNTVDTVIVGQYVGKQALAAVGTTGTIINLLVGFFVGVSSGATVIISPVFRCRRREKRVQGPHTSMALALAGSGIIMVVGLLTSRLSLEMLGVPEEIMDDA